MGDGWYEKLIPMIKKFKLLFLDENGQERMSVCADRQSTPRGNMYLVKGAQGYMTIGEKDVIKKF